MIGAVYIVGGGLAVSTTISPSRSRVQTGHEGVGVELRQRKVESEVKTSRLQRPISSSMIELMKRTNRGQEQDQVYQGTQRGDETSLHGDCS